MHVHLHTYAYIQIGVSLNSHCVSPKGRGCRSIERYALSSCNNDGPLAYVCNLLLRHCCSFSHIFYHSLWNTLLLVLPCYRILTDFVMFLFCRTFIDSNLLKMIRLLFYIGSIFFPDGYNCILISVINKVSKNTLPQFLHSLARCRINLQ